MHQKLNFPKEQSPFPLISEGSIHAHHPISRIPSKLDSGGRLNPPMSLQLSSKTLPCSSFIPVLEMLLSYRSVSRLRPRQRPNPPLG